MAAGSRPAVLWVLVATSALFAALALYVFFGALLPATRQMVLLEQELRTVYAQEARLHGTLAQVEERLAGREQEIERLRAERDALARRLGQLEGRVPSGPAPPQ